MFGHGFFCCNTRRILGCITGEKESACVRMGIIYTFCQCVARGHVESVCAYTRADEGVFLFSFFFFGRDAEST